MMVRKSMSPPALAGALGRADRHAEADQALYAAKGAGRDRLSIAA
jgi:GGDEF domain-containing protein